MKTIEQIVAEHTTDMITLVPESHSEHIADMIGVNEMIRKLEGQLKVRAHAAAYEEEIDHMAEFQRLRPKKSFFNPFFAPNPNY